MDGMPPALSEAALRTGTDGVGIRLGTGEVITSRGQEFLVTARTRGGAGMSDPWSTSSPEPINGA